MGRDYSVLKDNIGSDVGDTSTSTATIIGRYINRRYMDIIRRLNVTYINEDYTVSVVSGTQDYEMESDFIEAIYAVDTTNNTHLKRINLEDIPYEKSENVDATGSVSAYTIFDSDDGSKYLRVWKTPTSNLTISLPYRARPSELSDDTDEPVMGLEDVLEIGATADTYRYKKQFAKAREVEVQYETTLANWIWERESQRDKTVQFKPTVYSRDKLV